jgi:hypothetical protein
MGQNKYYLILFLNTIIFCCGILQLSLLYGNITLGAIMIVLSTCVYCLTLTNCYFDKKREQYKLIYEELPPSYGIDF